MKNLKELSQNIIFEKYIKFVNDEDYRRAHYVKKIFLNKTYLYHLFENCYVFKKEKILLIENRNLSNANEQKLKRVGFVFYKNMWCIEFKMYLAEAENRYGQGDFCIYI